MANILLKNVIAAAPAPLNMGVVQDPVLGAMFAQELIVPIKDTLGNPIDATAGTVSSSTSIRDVGSGISMNLYDAAGALVAASITADLSVIGSLKLVFARLASWAIPGSYRLVVTAIDSAGGSQQLLGSGSFNIAGI